MASSQRRLRLSRSNLRQLRRRQRRRHRLSLTRARQDRQKLQHNVSCLPPALLAFSLFYLFTPHLLRFTSSASLPSSPPAALPSPISCAPSAVLLPATPPTTTASSPTAAVRRRISASPWPAGSLTTSVMTVPSCWPPMTPSASTPATRSTARAATATPSAPATVTRPSAGDTSGWSWLSWSASCSPSVFRFAHPGRPLSQ